MIPLLLLALLSPAQALITPNKDLAFRIPDTSPLITFQQSGTVNRDRPTGWQQRFGQSTTPPTLGALGTGPSSHVAQVTRTTENEPAIAMKWAGTNAVVHGTVEGTTSERAVVASVNSKVLSGRSEQGYDAAEAIIFKAEANWAENGLNMWLDEEGSITVTHVVVSTGMVTSGSDAGMTTVEVVDGDAINSFFPSLNSINADTYGKPKIVQTIGPANGDTMSFPHLHVSNRTVFNVDVPAGTTFVYMNGTTGPQFGKYWIDAEPEAPFSPYLHALSAYNEWSIPDTYLYYAPLDPSVKYTLSVHTSPDTSSRSGEYLEGGGVGISSFTFYSEGPGGGNSTTVSGSPASGGKKTNIGAIVGGVVGGVGGAILLGVMAWCFLRRRRRAAASADSHAVYGEEKPYDAKAHIARAEYNTPVECKPGAIVPEGSRRTPIEPADVGEDTGRLEAGPPAYNAAWEGK